MSRTAIGLGLAIALVAGWTLPAGVQSHKAQLRPAHSAVKFVKVKVPKRETLLGCLAADTARGS